MLNGATIRLRMIQASKARVNRKRMKLPFSLRALVRVLGREANCNYLPRGAPLRIDSTDAQRLAGRLGMDLGPGYAERVIGKYYGRHASA